MCFVNGPNGTLIERVNLVSTESYGMEADFTFRLLDNLSLEGNVTWQEHEYHRVLHQRRDQSGHHRQRARCVSRTCCTTLGLYYDDGGFDAALFSTHTGDKFTTESNLIKLDAYDIVRLDAGYTFDWADMTARIGINVSTCSTTTASPRVRRARTCRRPRPARTSSAGRCCRGALGTVTLQLSDF